MRSTRTFLAALLPAMMLMAACAPSTEVVNVWRAPEAQTVQFKKILAACLCRDEGMRRAAEDRLAARLPNATPSYTVISREEAADREQAKAKIRELGFDGAVVMRLGAVDKDVTYVPGQAYAVPSTYGTMWGYWGYGWGAVYDPGYVQQNVVVNFETNLYSVTDDKLLWAGRSKTYDPNSVKQVIDEVVDGTVRKMKEDKVLAF